MIWKYLNPEGTLPVLAARGDRQWTRRKRHVGTVAGTTTKASEDCRLQSVRRIRPCIFVRTRSAPAGDMTEFQERKKEMTNELGAILYVGVSLCIFVVALLNSRTSKQETRIDRLQYKLKIMQYQVEAMQDIMDRLVTGDNWDNNENLEDEA